MNSLKKLCLFSLVCVACVGPSAALGQVKSAALGQVKSAARGISQLDAVAAAVRNNPTLHVALLQASQSRYLVRAEEALYTPLLNANAGVTHSRSPFLVGTNDVQVGSTDTVDLGAGLSKVFPFGTAVSVSLGGQRFLRSSEASALAFESSSGPGYSLLGQLAVTQPLLRGAGSDVGLASLRLARLGLSVNELGAQETASALLADVVTGSYGMQPR